MDDSDGCPDPELSPVVWIDRGDGPRVVFYRSVPFRGNTAELTVDEVAGTEPTLAAPEEESFPTVQIAEPVGWAEGVAKAHAEYEQYQASQSEEPHLD